MEGFDIMGQKENLYRLNNDKTLIGDLLTTTISIHWLPFLFPVFMQIDFS